MEKILFLNPSDNVRFYIETGWTSIGNKIKVPNKRIEWAVKVIFYGNSPIILQWNNKEGVILRKKLS